MVLIFFLKIYLREDKTSVEKNNIRLTIFIIFIAIALGSLFVSIGTSSISSGSKYPHSQPDPCEGPQEARENIFAWKVKNKKKEKVKTIFKIFILIIMLIIINI